MDHFLSDDANMHWYWNLLVPWYISYLGRLETLHCHVGNLHRLLLKNEYRFVPSSQRCLAAFRRMSLVLSIRK